MTQIREIYTIWGLDQTLFKQYIMTYQYADPLNLRNLWYTVKRWHTKIKTATVKSKMQKDVKNT